MKPRRSPATTIANVHALCRSVQASTRTYRSSSLTRLRGAAAGRLRSQTADTSGISVSDEKREQTSEMEMAMPTSLSQVVSSVLAPTTSGRKTMTVVSVEQVTAIVTSRAPTSAAVRASPRSRRLRSIDSRTTIASSTSIPTPSINPHIDSTFRLFPMKYMIPQAAMTENGMENETMSVESSRRRKK